MRHFHGSDSIEKLLQAIGEEGRSQLGPEGGPFDLTFELAGHIFKLRVELLEVDGKPPSRTKPS